LASFFKREALLSGSLGVLGVWFRDALVFGDRHDAIVSVVALFKGPWQSHINFIIGSEVDFLKALTHAGISSGVAVDSVGTYGVVIKSSVCVVWLAAYPREVGVG
jgi:hypothetical protein